jgi:pimeloyl-ACP methyl ester carboxylesterase
VSRLAASVRSSGEILLVANGVELCVETFGDPAHPAILLIHGACASMLWWERELAERLAARERYVIRYDNRDTGLSVFYPPGRPGYTLRDMTADAIGILDRLGVAHAHVVGRSMAGAIALVAGVDHAARVASLTFVGTSPGGGDLPPMAAAVEAYGDRGPDLSSPHATVEFIVGLLRTYAGDSPYFDARATRAQAALDVVRSRSMASALTNHFLIAFDGPRGGGFADLRVPSLVIHGSRDPVFPLAHGEALRRAIPGARLVTLDRAGHELPRALWEVFIEALVDHTAPR